MGCTKTFSHIFVIIPEPQPLAALAQRLLNKNRLVLPINSAITELALIQLQLLLAPKIQTAEPIDMLAETSARVTEYTKITLRTPAITQTALVLLAPAELQLNCNRIVELAKHAQMEHVAITLLRLLATLPATPPMIVEAQDTLEVTSARAIAYTATTLPTAV